MAPGTEVDSQGSAEDTRRSETRDECSRTGECPPSAAFKFKSSRTEHPSTAFSSSSKEPIAERSPSLTKEQHPADPRELHQSARNGRPTPQFTDGPIDVVIAHDGKKDCIAILLDRELLCSLQDLERTQLVVLKDQITLDMAGYDVELIEKYSDQQKRLEEIDKKARELQSQRREIEESLPKHTQALQRCEILERGLAQPKADVEDLGNQLQRTLLETLRKGNLLDVQAIKPSTGPKQRPRAPSYEDSVCSSSYVGTPEDYSAGFRQTRANLTEFPEESARRNAIAKLNRTREMVMGAQYQLDCRKQHYIEDLALHRYNLSEGVWSSTTTEFDNRQVQIGQELTRELIEAQEAFDNAMDEAKVACVGSDADSSYYGDYYEPSLVGIECEVLDKSVRPRIELWQDSLMAPSNLEHPEPTELDHWDAKTVDVSDSVSAIASDQYYRKNIDRWKGMRNAARREFGRGRERVQDEDGRDLKRRRSW